MTQRRIKTHSQETYKTITNAVKRLDNNAIASISAFIKTQYCPDGGFAGRDGSSDIYYTMFGLSCAAALNLRLPNGQIECYLRNIEPEKLDLPHLLCLVKCHTALFRLQHPALTRVAGHSSNMRKFFFRGALLDAAKNMLEHDSSNMLMGAYGWFLRMNLAQDCGLEVPGWSAVADLLEIFRKPDGGFSNFPETVTASTNATVAAVLLKRQLTGEIDERALRWISGQVSTDGGFKAFPAAAVSDLLSTATSLFALNFCGMLDKNSRNTAKNYIFSTWLESGGFAGIPDEGTADCEYTFYGLLAAGALI